MGQMDILEQVENGYNTHFPDQASCLRRVDDLGWGSEKLPSFTFRIPVKWMPVQIRWLLLLELSKLGLGSEIDLHIAELPAVYQKAKELVCEIWAAQPYLVIHVGLASTSKATIILEQCGKNKVYKERDVCGFLPEDGCCVSEGPERIESTVNMKRIWKNLLTEGIDVIFSRDAGRYVCDYTYYTSLYHGNRRAAFIHVPPLSKGITAEFLGRALQRVILEMLKQCKQKNREQSKGEPLIR